MMCLNEVGQRRATATSAAKCRLAHHDGDVRSGTTTTTTTVAATTVPQRVARGKALKSASVTPDVKPKERPTAPPPSGPPREVQESSCDIPRKESPSASTSFESPAVTVHKRAPTNGGRESAATWRRARAQRQLGAHRDSDTDEPRTGHAKKVRFRRRTSPRPARPGRHTGGGAASWGQCAAGREADDDKKATTLANARPPAASASQCTPWSGGSTTVELWACSETPSQRSPSRAPAIVADDVADAVEMTLQQALESLMEKQSLESTIHTFLAEGDAPRPALPRPVAHLDAVPSTSTMTSCTESASLASRDSEGEPRQQPTMADNKTPRLKATQPKRATPKDTYECCRPLGGSASTFSDVTVSEGSAEQPASLDQLTSKDLPEAATQVSRTTVDRRAKSITTQFELVPDDTVRDASQPHCGHLDQTPERPESRPEGGSQTAGTEGDATQEHVDRDVPRDVIRNMPRNVLLDVPRVFLRDVPNDAPRDVPRGAPQSAGLVSSLHLPSVKMRRDDQLFFARVTAVADAEQAGQAEPDVADAQYEVLVQGAVLARSIQVQTQPTPTAPAEPPAASPSTGPQRRARKVQTDRLPTWLPPLSERGAASACKPRRGAREARGGAPRPSRPTSAPTDAAPAPSEATPCPRGRLQLPTAHQKCFVDHSSGREASNVQRARLPRTRLDLAGPAARPQQPRPTKNAPAAPAARPARHAAAPPRAGPRRQHTPSNGKE